MIPAATPSSFMDAMRGLAAKFTIDMDGKYMLIGEATCALLAAGKTPTFPALKAEIAVLAEKPGFQRAKLAASAIGQLEQLENQRLVLHHE